MKLQLGSTKIILLLIFMSVTVQGQIIDSPSDTVAGIPANYIEAKVGSFELPDPLASVDGQLIDSKKLWINKRRPEIIKLFEQNQFGVTPKDEIKTTYDYYENNVIALDGKARRTQVTLNLMNENKHKINLLIYRPNNSEKSVPILLYISFRANSQVIDDPEIKEGYIWDRKTKKKVLAGRESRFPKIDISKILEAGFGFATVYYGDIEPDYEDGYNYGVRTLFENNNSSPLDKKDSWGSFAVWSWGLSRILDYFESDNNIDANRTAIMGVSRLGKTALWAGSLDERFAAVIPVCSGESGASLSRRDYGESIAHIAAPSRYHYWFAPKYKEYGSDVHKLPVDGHMLISLIAPRPILLITGNTDKWSDPYGEYLAAIAAEPVYSLLGKKGLETDRMPSPGKSVINDIGFFMHEGGHGMVSKDWEVILDFMKQHLK